MTVATGMIPRNRLRMIPKHLRLAHEYAFFLHDENVRLLKEYEAARATFVEVTFKDKSEAKRLAELDASGMGSLEILKTLGYPEQLRRVILNQITMALTSDCLHHLYEGLRCLEKRKVVVAFNLLRKPLLENLTYLSWMLGDEDDFYAIFTSGNVEALTGKRVGNRRLTILDAAIRATSTGDVVDSAFLNEAIFDPKSDYGLYGYFQHAVHLITMQRLELQTAPQNFNFVFKSYADDDLYEAIYGLLPALLFYLSNVILELFDRIKEMDGPAKRAFLFRSKFGFYLTEDDRRAEIVMQSLRETVAGHITCDHCNAVPSITTHNAARLLLTDSFRCTHCRRKNLFPFSWTF